MSTGGRHTQFVNGANVILDVMPHQERGHTGVVYPHELSGIGGIPSAGFAAVVGCAESFLCGDTAAMDDVFLADESVSPSGDESRQTRPSRRRVESRGVSLEWRGSDAVVLRRGNVEAAFGVRE